MKQLAIMRKIVYLCAIMMLSMNMIAQFDPHDQNWDTIVFDDFDEPNRYFDNTFQDSEGKWLSFMPSLWPSGVTKRDSVNNELHCEYQIYQWNQCVFDDRAIIGANGVLKLKSKFKSAKPILCDDPLIQYTIPPAYYGNNYHCDGEHYWLYYFSGTIHSLFPAKTKNTDTLPEAQYRYGYFEIRCQLPVHDGAFPAFWLWGSKKDRYYEEIDIFEVSRSFTDPGNSWSGNPHPHGLSDINTFTTGLYYNATGSSSLDPTSQARNFPAVSSDTDLTDWHTFACEWLPEYIKWYCDGDVVNEYHNPDSIPRHHLSLIANYAIDKYALQSHNPTETPVWQDSSSMVIDYIKVLQLACDCYNDAIIACQSDYENFLFKVMQNIAITSTINPVCVESTDRVTFRVTNSFEITGPFQVDGGGEMTVITQRCPN